MLVPDVLERTPAYVDQVRPGTAAARAGLQPDDLILLVGNHLTQSCKALRKELEMIDRADAVKITILRGQELLEVTLQAGPDDTSEALRAAAAEGRLDGGPSKVFTQSVGTDEKSRMHESQERTKRRNTNDTNSLIGLVFTSDD